MTAYVQRKKSENGSQCHQHCKDENLAKDYGKEKGKDTSRYQNCGSARIPCFKCYRLNLDYDRARNFKIETKMDGSLVNS